MKPNQLYMPNTIAKYRRELNTYLALYNINRADLKGKPNPFINKGLALNECKRLKVIIKSKIQALHGLLRLAGLTA